MQTGRWRTFWRLFGTYTVLVLVLIGVLGWIIVHRVETYEQQQIEETLFSKVALVEEATRFQPLEYLPSAVRRLARQAPGRQLRITLLADDGRVLADSADDPPLPENHANSPEVSQARLQGTGISSRFGATGDDAMMYAAKRTDADGPVAFVRVGLPLDAIRDRLSELDRIVWSFAGGSAAAALILAFWLARRITRPLLELTAGAERIASGDYGHKVYAVRADEIGALARAFNTMSERLAAQFRQVEEDRQQLRTVLSGMDEGVIAIDAEQRVLFANERAVRLLDLSAEMVVGRKLWEVARHRSIQEVVQRAERNPEPYREELDWSGPAVKSMAVYVARLAGKPSPGAVLVLQDTTELRRLERLRRDFVANVSHELKTPLSVIKVCIETLLDGAVEDPENRCAFLEQIDEQANRLHMLILDLLSLARIESGAELFDVKAVPIGPLVHECVERHGARAEAKNQLLVVVGGQESGGSKEGTVAAWVDEEAVGQILDNLVDNAIKYTPEGGRIGVGWRVEERCVVLEVEDTGIGIPERDLPRIFERFYRVDKARSREMGGTGLGLSIVKHLVQAMNGTVSAASRLGKGTTFTVRLPRASAM